MKAPPDVSLKETRANFGVRSESQQGFIVLSVVQGSLYLDSSEVGRPILCMSKVTLRVLLFSQDHMAGDSLL